MLLLLVWVGLEETALKQTTFGLFNTLFTQLKIDVFFRFSRHPRVQNPTQTSQNVWKCLMCNYFGYFSLKNVFSLSQVLDVAN